MLADSDEAANPGWHPRKLQSKAQFSELSVLATKCVLSLMSGPMLWMIQMIKS
jgi:hypothetical protein